jgi:hypothetical protein
MLVAEMPSIQARAASAALSNWYRSIVTATSNSPVFDAEGCELRKTLPRQ